jgi:hypothetical protein
MSRAAVRSNAAFNSFSEFVEDRSEHGIRGQSPPDLTHLLGGAEPIELCCQLTASTELFQAHSIYVSS